MPVTAELPQLTTEADVQRLLAGESIRGPRVFRGRQLADYTAGLRDLVTKVVSRQDSAVFHDVVMLYILAEAHAPTPEQKAVKRRALITATDDPEGFRTMVNLTVLDDLGDQEILDARHMVDGILRPVQLAQVTVAREPGKSAKKKQGGVEPGEIAILAVSLCPVLGVSVEQLRWEVPLVEVYGYRAAQLYLAGWRLKRLSSTARNNQAKRARFDEIAARFNRRTAP